MLTRDNVFGKVIDFACSDTEEFRKARKEFCFQRQQKEKDIDPYEFLDWYAFRRKHSDKEVTFVELFADKLSADDKQAVLSLRNNIHGFFEVMHIKDKVVYIKDLETEHEYEVIDSSTSKKVSPGDVVCTTVFPFKGCFYFSGKLDVYDRKIHAEFIAHTKDYLSGKLKPEALSMQKDMARAFMQFFKCNDPVFENGKKAEKALNDFYTWYNRNYLIPDKGKTPEQLWLEEHKSLPKVPRIKLTPMYSECSIGIVFDELAGCGIFPKYGYVKTLLEGDYLKITNYEDIVHDLVEDEGFIDSYILNKMINRNKQRAVIVFRKKYPTINDIEDIHSLMRSKRKDWDDSPMPTIIPVNA